MPEQKSNTAVLCFESAAKDEVITKLENPAQNAVIGIGPVKLADYLDQSDLVTRTNSSIGLVNFRQKET